jgi:hypothetical protein
MTWLEPTRKCNITCDACFADNDPRSEKSLTQIQLELNHLLKLRKCDAMLIGGGEPLTHPQIVDIVAMIKRAGVKPVLITNGVGIDALQVRAMKSGGLHGITFHVDSHQARPGWEGATESELNELRQRLAELVAGEGGLGCAFNTTIFPDTLKDVPAIVAWAAGKPDLVQIVTLIAVRMAQEDGPYNYFVGDREVDFGRSPYVSPENYGDLTAVEIFEEIRRVVPDFEFSAFLGGTVNPESLKWAIGNHICSRERSYGSLGGRAMELFQNLHHLVRSRYLAYTHPRDTRKGRSALLLSLIDPMVRKTARRYVRDLVRHPSRLFHRLFVQSISVVQPVDVLPNGETDTCDGCPNKTYWAGRLVSACRLEEYRMFGGPVTIVPRAN